MIMGLAGADVEAAELGDFTCKQRAAFAAGFEYLSALIQGTVSRRI
jgi:hypothetical protein